jgi:hypothetical protein
MSSLVRFENKCFFCVEKDAAANYNSGVIVNSEVVRKWFLV